MESGRAQTNENDRDQHGGIIVRKGKQQHAGKGKAHTDGQNGRGRPFVRKPADDGLHDGCGEVDGERDPSDLSITQVHGILQNRENRRNDGLDGIIEQMHQTDGDQDPVHGALGIRSGVDFGTDAAVLG
ncbi:hypothetical protein D1872_253690 [compost metagenome]